MKKEVRRLYKPFLFFFLVGLVVANWNDICLVSNYRFISGHLSAFTQEKDIEASPEIRESFEEGSVLIIPKLGLKVPIVFQEIENPKNFAAALKKGVLHYPGSDLPGQEGNAVLLGHSAPPSWPKKDYDWVFTNLNELEKGDNFSIYFAKQKYFYKVKDKFFLKRGEEAPDLTNLNSSVTLISCWPPGKDQKRIAVTATLR